MKSHFAYVGGTRRERSNRKGHGGPIGGAGCRKSVFSHFWLALARHFYAGTDGQTECVNQDNAEK